MRAKQGLRDFCFKDQNWSPFWESSKTDGRRREEEEEEEKKKRREEERKIKGMETNLEYEIVWIYGILRLCMVNSLSPNLGF